MDLFDDHLVLSHASHPNLREHLKHLKRTRQVWSPLPGTFTPHPDSWDVRVHAALHWGRNLPLAGASAARLTWWPELELSEVWLAGAKRRSPAPWLRVTQDHLSPQLIWEQGGLRAVAAEVSVLQMAARDQDALFEAVRRDMSTAGLLEALELMPKFMGKSELRRLLKRSRDRPFSALEVLAHEDLRKADIACWTANTFVNACGENYCADLLFGEHRLIVELDGWRFHNSHQSFIDDRIRQNHLVLAGWTVLRYTHETVGDLVGQVRRVLARGGG